MHFGMWISSTTYHSKPVQNLEKKNTYNLRNQKSASTETGLTTQVPGDKSADYLVPVGPWNSYFCISSYYIWPNHTTCYDVTILKPSVFICSDHSFCIRIRPKRNSQERGGEIVREMNHSTWLRCFVMITIIRFCDGFLSKITPLVVKGCNMKCAHIFAACILFCVFQSCSKKCRRALPLMWKHLHGNLKNLNTTLEGKWDAAIYNIYICFCWKNSIVHSRYTAVTFPQ